MSAPWLKLGESSLSGRPARDALQAWRPRKVEPLDAKRMHCEAQERPDRSAPRTSRKPARAHSSNSASACTRAHYALCARPLACTRSTLCIQTRRASYASDPTHSVRSLTFLCPISCLRWGFVVPNHIFVPRRHINRSLCFPFPDMSCMKRVYGDKKASVQWSATRKKELLLSRGQNGYQPRILFLHRLKIPGHSGNEKGLQR